ncbi:GNAT family N-acetyltransferase [Deinococcus detaillensis]|uniref:GNAT family N-acetyltransferase n=1 Tax=Deinococcus detaillensis TaxID=2592048 RepID=A0A553V5H6_9DEIO|nr:GNAT family N-acetyltransferase [Deinococcus detaillensis]TSA87717.1 GNAT family N-acetyltransferase [Deinococcus detaillensis]
MSGSSKEILLKAYDAQLREGAEMLTADRVDRLGPLWLGKFGDWGFVSYRSLGGYAGDASDRLIAETTAYYAADPQIKTFEWKTRGHDSPADLPQRLTAQGFQAEDPETVMLGEAQFLAQPIKLPTGVTLRRIDNQPGPYPDVVRAARAQERAFGAPYDADDLMRRIEKGAGRTEVWVAETQQEMVCVGRLEVIPNTEFAGLWGGGTLPEWRGQGIYRALTAARAQAALKRGVRYLHSDCTEYSRPILERGGLLPVMTTTPYIWRR